VGKKYRSVGGVEYELVGIHPDGRLIIDHNGSLYYRKPDGSGYIVGTKANLINDDPTQEELALMVKIRLSTANNLLKIIRELRGE